MVRVWNLKKGFQRRGGEHVTAVNDVSLTIAPGKLVVLLGPSGCGKTTLLRCIAGLEHPDAGRIEINGKCVFDSDEGIRLAPEHRAVSMMFQSYALWPHMTAYRNVEYAVRSRGHARDADARVTRALTQVGIPQLRDQFPAQMSGGQQQRVALARSLAVDPPVVLFDEPLSNVDAKVRDQLRQELVAMQRTVRFAGVYVTHDQLEAMQLADRMAIMNNGSIVQLDTPMGVYRNPVSRYVACFVGQANELDASVTAARADGRELDLDTPLGPMVAAHERVWNPAVGARVRIIVRPEDLKPVSGAPPAGHNVLRGSVQVVMFSGAHVEYRIRVGTQLLHARSDNRGLLAEGDEVTLAFEPAAVYVFPEDDR
ncbi:MAG: ABC transporter ATP-binding protein [Burkholderiales bacterium]|nr:ABC transporter ATP-binding protein [Burkholderiales bacterium]